MAQPWFQCQHLVKPHGLIALSSNYALYADMSRRVMAILAGFTPEQEVYSIDEFCWHFRANLKLIIVK